MSQSFQPYQSPKSSLADTSEEPAIDYARCWTYFFESPTWQNDLLYSSLTLFIPILGQMMIDGFAWERAALLCGDLRGNPEPYDFGKLSRYVERGAWKLVLAMILSFVMQFVAGACFVGVILLFLLLNGGPPRQGQPPPVGFIIGFYVGFLAIWLLLILSYTLIHTAMCVHAERTADIRSAFDFEYVGDFVSKMWPEILLTTLFRTITGQVVVTLGLLCCIVGIFPAIVLFLAAEQYFHLRLYQVYVARGGRPIPVHVNQALPMPVMPGPLPPPKPPLV